MSILIFFKAHFSILMIWQCRISVDILTVCIHLENELIGLCPFCSDTYHPTTWSKWTVWGKYKYANKVLEIFRWFFITTFVEPTYWISWQSYLSIIYLNTKYLLIIFGEIYFLVSNTIVSILEEEKGNWFVKQKNLHQYLVWPLAA